MQAGASATARDKDGCTPLDVAMAHAACVSDEHAHTQAQGVCALLAAVQCKESLRRLVLGLSGEWQVLIGTAGNIFV